ncbi:MAG: hypothetical protein NT062_03745 [Proteobacteria bacterium]|nr:hypothetical protein [Pseudomonadota bacterium]
MTFAQDWQRRWPRCRPIGHELRACARATWVRFHSLPVSRRYPEDEADVVELLHRHDTILDDLVAASADERVVVITCAWSDGPTPVPRDAATQALRPDAAWVMSVEESVGSWTHLHAETLAWRRGELAGLLRAVACDAAGGVIVADADLTWLYHPYDGGGDVIAASALQRDRLRTTYRDWLSAHPEGL